MTGVINPDRLHQWRSELDQFVSQARLQLESLNQLLAQCQTDSRSLPATMTRKNGSDQTPPFPLDTSLTSPLSLSVVEVTTEDQMNRDADCDSVAGDIDLMERLNAIKLRLAEQIQNT